MAVRSQRRPYRVPSAPKRRRGCQRRGRYLYLKLMRLDGTPAAVARGLAIGSFSGMFPIFGFQIIVSILLAIVVRGNKLAAAAATWVSNPFTYVPLMTFNFRVGQWVLGTHQLSLAQLGNLQSIDRLGNPQQLNQLVHTVLELGGSFLATLLMGCFTVGIVFSTCTYFGSRRLIRRYHQQRRLRRSRHRPLPLRP